MLWKHLFLFTLVTNALSTGASESMKQMPMLKSKTRFEIKSVEQGKELEAQRGFGDHENEVRMMNLMMVEGSGYEGMDMSGGAETAKNSPSPKETHHHHQPSLEPYTLRVELKQDHAQVGPHQMILTITDTQTGKPLSGLKLQASVYMTSMDMGTDHPTVKEIHPGSYRLKVVFSMAGPWAVKLASPRFEKILSFQVEPKP